LFLPELLISAKKPSVQVFHIRRIDCHVLNPDHGVGWQVAAYVFITRGELSDAFLSWLEANRTDSSAKVVDQTDTNKDYDFGIFIALVGSFTRYATSGAVYIGR
jgi:hypothetical protein